MVTVRSRLFASDEENAKRNDDFKPIKAGPWDIRNKPIWRRKRLAGIVLAGFFVWLFIHYIPTDLGHINQQRRPQYLRNNPSRPQRALPKSEHQSHQEQPREAVPDTVPLSHSEVPDSAAPAQLANSYDGPVKFFNLATSLHGIANIVDYRQGNRHVLFAASDLNSLAAILPTACEMSKWKRNNVHVAVMGREELPLEEIMDINGATYKSCPVYWHDARPDMASISTDGRMQLSVAGAVGHINTYMLPRAIITADAEHETVYFSVGVSRTAKPLGITHITIPKQSPEKVAWLARLDANSLNSWHNAGFDILVQAPLDSSGSLIRLLTSLGKADYTGFDPPRLVIELPHTIDMATKNFLTGFKWPPFGTQTFGRGDQLVIRRRISEQHIPSEEASRRFIESFYPASPRGPHVLLLSSQVELSPAFFHYLKLHLLEYRHSYTRPNPARDMLGISLETPSTHLNASSEFIIPHAIATSGESEDDGPSAFEPFRWQAPNSNAALYFSDKWIELHSFMTKRRTASLHSYTTSHHAERVKHVSEKQPSWMEYTLDLMRARGYYLHYPGIFFRHAISSSDSSFSSAEQSLVIVHNELFQPPEEFLHAIIAREGQTTVAPRAPAATVFTVSADYLATHHPSESSSNSLNDERPLLRNLNPLLPELFVQDEDDEDEEGFLSQEPQDPLPPLSSLPLLDYTGSPLTYTQMEDMSRLVSRSYRRFAGGCTEEQSKLENKEPGSAEDLFCLEDDDNIASIPEYAEDNTSGVNKQNKAKNEKINNKHQTQETGQVEAREDVGKTTAKPVPTRIHGSEGAAAAVNRVVDADNYLATAKAGFAKKLADKEKNYQRLTLLESKKLALTDEEKKWLEEHKHEEEDTQDSGDAVLGESKDEIIDDANLADEGGEEEHFEVHVNIPGNSAPLQETASRPIMRGSAGDNDHDDEFFRLVTNGREKGRKQEAVKPVKPATTIDKGNSNIQVEASTTESKTVEEPGNVLPLDKQALPAAGQTFEEQMNARDAAKKDRLNDRDRARKTRMRVVGDVDTENLANAPADSGLRRTGPAKGSIRKADESEEELIAVPAAGEVTTPKAKVAGKLPNRVTIDEDSDGVSFQHSPGEPDMHPGHLEEEDERLGTGEGQVAHVEAGGDGDDGGDDDGTEEAH